jgi:hypothetical protein
VAPVDGDVLVAVPAVVVAVISPESTAPVVVASTVDVAAELVGLEPDDPTM